jgi:UDP-2,3-diacylglucosamine pyrophosphatase LpxH
VLQRWILEFRQCSFRRITRASPRTTVHDFRAPRLFQHAVVPSGFRRQVSWMVQGHCSRTPLNCVESLRYSVTWRTLSERLLLRTNTSFQEERPARARPHTGKTAQARVPRARSASRSSRRPIHLYRTRFRAKI